MAERNDLISQYEEKEHDLDRSVDEIRQDIAARRESIAETVDRIGERFSRALDWRENVSQHPLLAVGAAVGAGLLLSAIFKPRPTVGERIMYALADGVEDVSDGLRYQLEDVGVIKSNRLGNLAGISGTVKATLAATITKVAMDYLSGKVATSRGTSNNRTDHRNLEQSDVKISSREEIAQAQRGV